MTMLEHALHYAAQGWAVLPLHGISNGHCACGNPDCSSPGKHPLISGGCKSATIDPKTIEGWWRAHPAANIGIATGQISRLIVIDVDVGEGKVGFESLAALEETHEKLPRSARVRTGSGGLHIYLAAPQAEIRNSTSKLAPNIDIRGEGGYVVAPPSLHLSGNMYSSEQPMPASNKLAEFRNWMTEFLASPRPANTNASPSGFMVKGRRNSDLASTGGFLRHNGMNEQDIFQVLQSVNSTSSDPVSDDEVAAVAHSMMRYSSGGAEMYDLPLSRAVAEAISDTCRHVPQTGWKVYDGSCWVQDVNGILAKERIKCQLETHFEAVRRSGDADAIRSARAYLSNAKINAVVALVQSDPSVRA